MDRGYNSLEVFTILLLLKARYVYLGMLEEWVLNCSHAHTSIVHSFVDFVFVILQYYSYYYGFRLSSS